MTKDNIPLIERFYNKIFSRKTKMPEKDWDSWYTHKINKKRAFLGQETFKNERYYNLILETIKRVTRKTSFKGEKVIELGAGSGLASVFLSIDGADSTILDSSLMAIKYAKLNVSKIRKESLILGKIKYVKANLFDLNKSVHIKNESFDLVQSYGLIEHFNDKDIKKILEIKKSLTKKGGWVVVGVPNYISPIMIYKWSKGKGNERYLNKSKLKSLMKEVGLKEIKVVFLPYVYTEFSPIYLIKMSSSIENFLGRMGLGSMYLAFGKK